MLYRNLVQSRPLYLAAAVGLASFILYVATLAPDVVGGDAGEFQFVPYVLGIPHHTGYPLYTLLGKVWSFLPTGSIAFRMNLLSAVFAAAAVALVYLAAWEMTGRLGAAILAAASLAVTNLFWQWATIAGVRSSTALMAALVIYLAVRWRNQTQVGARGAAARTFAFLWLSYGAALAHHRSAILLAVPLALFVLGSDARNVFRPRVVFRSALLFVLPLLTYLYLPIRSAMGASFDQFHPDTLPRFLDLVLATRLSQSFLSVPLDQMPLRWEMLGAEISREFGLVGLSLGLLGVLWLLWRRPLTFALTALFALGVAAQTLDWNVGQDRLNVVYLIPAYVVAALWIACGAALVGDVIGRVWGRLPLRALALLGVTLGLLVPFLQLGAATREGLMARALQPMDKFRQNLDAGLLPRRLVMASLPYLEDNAVVFGDWEQATPFWYAQQVEGLKPGVDVMYGVDSIAEMEKLAAGRPLYLARAVPDTGSRRFASVGPLIKLVQDPAPGQSTAPSGAPTALRPLNLVLGSEIALLGYVPYDERGHPVERFGSDVRVLPLTLFWQARTRPSADYSVSLRLMDAGDKMGLQYDNKPPVPAMPPPSRWMPGEVIGDYCELSPNGLPPGTYRLEALMYSVSAQGFHNLDVVDASGRPVGERAVVAEITLQ